MIVLNLYSAFVFLATSGNIFFVLIIYIALIALKLSIKKRYPDESFIHFLFRSNSSATEDVKSVQISSQRHAAKVFFYFLKHVIDIKKFNEDYYVILYRKIHPEKVPLVRKHIRKLFISNFNIKKAIFILNENSKIKEADYRLKIVNFMLKYALEDRILSEKEDAVIKDIALQLKISEEDYEALKQHFLDKIEAEDIAEKLRREAQKRQYQANYSQSSYTFGLKSAFALLDIPQTATADEIKKAYRKKVNIWHPDRFARQGQEAIDKAEDKFQELTTAYEFIKQKRGIA